MAHAHDQDLVDEEADDDRGRREQDVVDEADDLGELRVAAVLGHVGAGEDADRRADDDAHHGQDQAADDGVGEAAGAARRRRVLGEDRQREAGEAVPQKRRQDHDEPQRRRTRSRRPTGPW